MPEECLQLAPNSVEVKNLLKEAIQKSWNVKSPIKRKHGSDVAIDRIYAFLQLISDWLEWTQLKNSTALLAGFEQLS
uniref:Uncharacterized protein n=1 Tax=Ditylenchus dipsaci TaxID=166011 RepID=A0A915EFS9_9BILA